MLELVRKELVTPINPIEVLENPWEITRPFIELVERNRTKLLTLQNSFRQGQRGNMNIAKTANIHTDKFDANVFHALEELGLAERGHGCWYSVEQKTANYLMSYLASIISAKTDRLPITDYVRPTFYKQSFNQERRKRETLLTNLIPFPEEIDLNRLLRFKEQYYELLNAFQTRIELIVLDPNIIEGSPLFYQHLTELHQRKEELSAKMKESRFNSIVFGTVCGLIGAYQGLALASKGAIIGGLPGFANAVYSALKIERAENVFDQSGLKYLALADRRLRR